MPKLFWLLVLSYIFTNGDDFPGHIEFSESPPNYLFLSNLQTGWTYFCPLVYQQQLTTIRIEPSNSWTLESTLRDPGAFPVENELNELIPPLTIQLLHSWTTLSGDLHTSLLKQTGPRLMAEYFIPDLPSNSWTFGSTLRDPEVPSRKGTRRINSASDNSATSFLNNL